MHFLRLSRSFCVLSQWKLLFQKHLMTSFFSTLSVSIFHPPKPVRDLDHKRIHRSCPNQIVPKIAFVLRVTCGVEHYHRGDKPPSSPSLVERFSEVNSIFYNYKTVSIIMSVEPPPAPPTKTTKRTDYITLNFFFLYTTESRFQKIHFPPETLYLGHTS